jgi:enoyl-CoA hydratase
VDDLIGEPSGVTWSAHAGVATVTLSRPGRANALTAPLVDALLDAVDGAERAGCTVLEVRSAEPQFCAGFDLDAAQETTADLAWRFLRVGLLLERLRSSPLLTVAVVSGAAVGAGADVAAACDVRVGTERAWFAFPGSAFGVVLGTRRLAGLVGEARAVRLAATGERLRAGEALSWGLLDALVPDDELDAAVRRWTGPASTRDPRVLAALKAAAHPAPVDPASFADLARSLASRPTLLEDLLRFREQTRPNRKDAR